MIVEPTKLIPRFFKSRDIMSDVSFFIGYSLRFSNLCVSIFLLVKVLRYFPKLQNSFWISINIWAFLIVACIFSLFLMIQSFLRSSCSFFSSYKATFCISKLSNACLYVCLLFRIVNQERPACAHSSIRA